MAKLSLSELLRQLVELSSVDSSYDKDTLNLSIDLTSIPISDRQQLRFQVQSQSMSLVIPRKRILSETHDTEEGQKSRGYINPSISERRSEISIPMRIEDTVLDLYDSPNLGGTQRLVIVELDPRTPELPTTGLPTDDVLVNLWKQLSNKALNKLYPEVWTPNGHWKAGWAHLKTSKKPTNDRTIPNKVGLTWCMLYGKILQCNPVDIPPQWNRIVISVVRSSGVSPTYGREGMIQRGKAAANAWIRLSPDDTALTIVHTRVKTSSCVDLSSKEAYLQEILRLLEAANRRPGTRVKILSIGIDGLTTHPESISYLNEKYPNIASRLICVVPRAFPESMSDYPVLANGIRYGVFDLGAIASATTHYDSSPNLKKKRLVDLWRLISGGKSGDLAGVVYTDWTGDRNGFRVNPDTVTGTGIDEELPLMSRELR
ncbi:uncharacterized protein F5Z01DRAFT_633727 [Emericellopsis atlantica]|uniref:Uncharacterized protein n=1 Tax=Emericellopsis atlantica TaxID=2614577 RepID=A0A9P7ZRF5_9HYPO|nr:uncharacterized protein F5Z01DRAFT_633727 [Emericellopsis atlantica]KAG9256954.1 hypothetical protein F5Z01DRAFT_633727 [Emericellopsis atlantica]